MGTSCSKERENQPKETVSAEQMQGFMVNPVQQAKQQNSPQTSFQCKGLSEITHSLILEGSFVEGKFNVLEKFPLFFSLDNLYSNVCNSQKCFAKKIFFFENLNWV